MQINNFWTFFSFFKNFDFLGHKWGKKGKNGPEVFLGDIYTYDMILTFLRFTALMRDQHGSVSHLLHISVGSFLLPFAYFFGQITNNNFFIPQGIELPSFDLGINTKMREVPQME